MATLNTLRTRGGIIVSVVIGIALLAFLLGDLSGTSGMMNANKMRVGEIDGKNIGYLEFTERTDYLTQIHQALSGGEALPSDAQDQIYNEAWNEFIATYMLDPGFKKLGIAVTEPEQIDMVDGAYISPIIEEYFRGADGNFDPEMLRNFIASLGYGNTEAVWSYIKKQMNRQRAMEKYMNLVQKGVFVTDIEVERGMEGANALNNISFLSQDYTSIADSTVTVTPAEIKEYYNQHKRIFRQSATRDIEYVVFDVLPSEEDYTAAREHMNMIAEEFAENETPMQYATVNSQSPVSQGYFSANQMPEEIAAYVFSPDSETMYGPVLEGTIYTLARVADKKMMPDTLGARHILLAAGQDAVADSIVSALKGGAEFNQLSAIYSMDTYAMRNGGDLGRFSPNQMFPEFSNALIDARVNDIFKVNSQAGLHVVELTYKSEPVEKAQVALITYEVEPSEYTQQTIYDEVSKFIASAAEGYDDFKNATAENALAKRVARLRNTERDISGMENSREVVRWAFNAKAGEVSPVMEVEGDYVVAALASAAEDGVASLDDVSEQIETLLRFRKKGVMIAEKMQGGSLSAVASALAAEVKEAAGIELGSFYVDGIGTELKLIGAVAAAQPGVMSKPVEGAEGVYLFEVTSREATEATTPERERIRLESLGEAYMGERLNQALLESGDIVDYRVKYF